MKLMFQYYLTFGVLKTEIEKNYLFHFLHENDLSITSLEQNSLSYFM